MCCLKAWSQDHLPKTLPKSLPSSLVFSFFLVIKLACKYIREQNVQKKLGAQLNKASFFWFESAISFLRMYLGNQFVWKSNKIIV